MPKINYTKAEEAFEQAMRKHAVEQMLEDALWKNLGEGTQFYRENDPHRAKTAKMIEHMLLQIQTHLKQIKEIDNWFYEHELALTAEEEKKFFGSPKELVAKDWQRLKQIKDIADQFEPPKSPEETPEDVEQITSQQKEHRHKRYNVKKGWLPLQ